MDKIPDVIYFFLAMRSGKNQYSHYLPVNREALLWEIFCKDAGMGHTLPGEPYPAAPGKHPRAYADSVTTGRTLREYQAVYITSGGGWLNDAVNGRQEIRAGDIFMLFPGIEHSYSPDPATGWREYWVGFDGPHARRLEANGLFSPQKTVFRIGLDEALMGDYEQIIQLCRHQPSGFQVVLGVKILQLLAHLHLSEKAVAAGDSETDLIRSARSIMQLRLESGIEMYDLAKEVGVSYLHLLSVFRLHTGLTPYQYFLQLRIYKAQELLQDPKLSIKEIAEIMNFDNQYYFSRIFKHKTGMSPLQWRESPNQPDTLAP
jgi:AraC-like DNA-binding protein